MLNKRKSNGLKVFIEILCLDYMPLFMMRTQTYTLDEQKVASLNFEVNY